MEAEGMGAQQVMSDDTWKVAIDYINKTDKTSTSEAVCNGIWNEILRRNFPHPKFIIAPEQRQATGKRPDFTIFFMDRKETEWNPMFTFEGKAPYHIEKESIVKEGKKQAAGYVPDLAWSKQEQESGKGRYTYGMFACGKSFTILKHNVDDHTTNEHLTSSLDTGAKAFDDFCKEHADSF